MKDLTVKHPAKAFHAGWWEDFLEKTQNMSRPAVFKSCLSRDDTQLMRHQILDVVSTVSKLRTNRFGFRVYIEGTVLENNEMIEIYDAPPSEKESVEQWAKRVFGSKKFGIIMNQGERFNPELSQALALKLKPLLDKIGIPTEGIIFTLFIGNYDQTPLGIHRDLKGKSVLHFHLGPSGKTIYTWDTKEYEDQVGEKKYNNKEVEKHLSYANEYTYEESDLFFMQEDTYHMGIQDGLSIAIACWFYNRSNFDFATRLQALLSDRYLSDSTENLKPDKHPIGDTTGVEKTLDLFELPSYLENLSFKELMLLTYKDLRYSLHSNAGYRTNPFPREDKADLNANSVIQIIEPFKLLYKESLDGAKLQLFVRGKKIELNNFKCIKNLINKLNKKKPVVVSALISILDEGWNEAVAYQLLSVLYQSHGIRVLPHA